jgi:hypothetical protein
MLRFHLTFTGSTLFFLSISLGPLLFPAQARGDQSSENLQLEVFINDAPTNMISSFVRFTDGGIGAKESDLEQLGLRHCTAPRAKSFCSMRFLPCNTATTSVRKKS